MVLVRTFEEVGAFEEGESPIDEEVWDWSGTGWSSKSSGGVTSEVS